MTGTSKPKAVKKQPVWPEVNDVDDLADDFDELIMIDKGAINRSLAMRHRRELDAANSVLFIEFLERGNFHIHLTKAAEQKKRFPDKVLWEMFECCRSMSGYLHHID